MIYFFSAAFILYELTVLATTAGPHRLWSHRSYKAKWPMRLILMLLHTMAFQVDDFLDIGDNCDVIMLLVNHQTLEQMKSIIFWDMTPCSLLS
jgi:hypothetical protein